MGRLSVRHYYANPMDAWRVRELLDQADLTEEAAARALEGSAPTLRSYCDGKEPLPRNVILALKRLVDMRGQDEA